MTDSNFKIGDIVAFTHHSNEFWQGGKAEVIKLSGEVCGHEYITTRVTEQNPKNPSNTKIGDIVEERPSNLTLVRSAEAVEHPAHYGGDTTYEVIKVAEAWGLDKDAYLFNVLKYIARAGKKEAAKELEDLKKGSFYINRRIKQLEGSSSTSTTS